MTRFDKIADRLFPADLGPLDRDGYRLFVDRYAAPQIRVSMWLAVCTVAAFGIWDLPDANGGMLTTRLRYIVACPVLAVLAAASNSRFSQKQREIYLIVFYTVSITLVSFLVILIDKESPFKFVTGNATMNICLTIFFGYGLLPLFIMEGLLFGFFALLAHLVLLTFYASPGILVGSFYMFHSMVAVTIGMFIAYWREFSVRSSYRYQQEVRKIKVQDRPIKILISYRRSDADAIAGRIRDKLVSYFDEASIFIDIDSIPVGVDFRTQITKSLELSDVMLVILGRNWTGSNSTGPSRRIDEPDDPVRTEVEVALRRSVPIVPVLVSGATMPEPNDFPPSIRELAFLNAAEVASGRDFHLHMERLKHSLEQIRDAKQQQRPTLIDPVVNEQSTVPRV